MTDKPNQPPETNRADLTPIAEALGLHAEADAEEILSAINTRLTPDPAHYVPIEAVRELLQANGETTAAMNASQATAKVNTAVEKGYITPGMRGWALSLCSQDPESFDAFLSSAVPAYGHLSQNHGERTQLHGGASPRRGTTASGDALAICGHMGIDPAKLAD